MAEETIKTIKVYERDAERMTQMFGGPQWRAFHLALANSPCTHPEGMRVYTTALVPAYGEEALTQGQERQISGFRCGACGNYVFPDGKEFKE